MRRLLLSAARTEALKEPRKERMRKSNFGTLNRWSRRGLAAGLACAWLCGAVPAARAQIFQSEYVGWQNFTGTAQTVDAPTGSTLKRTAAVAGTSDWSADAISRKFIAGDGWVEFRFDQTNKQMAVGLAGANTDRSYTSLAHCIRASGGTFTVRENGVAISAAAAYAAGDVFRIERSGTKVTYKRNGTAVTLSTPSAPSQGVLWVDSSFADLDASISECRCFGPNLPDDVRWLPSFGAGGFAAAYGEGGAGSEIAKTAATAAYDVDAISSKGLPGDGVFRFRFAQVDKALVAGFSSTNPDAGFGSIRHGLGLSAGGVAGVWESGVQVPGVSVSFTAADVFSIRRSGSVVTYAKNGTVFHTSAVASTGFVFVDCALGALGAGLKGCQIEGYPLAEAAGFEPLGSAVAALQPAGSSVSDSSGSADWLAGALSVRSLPPGASGGFYFRFGGASQWSAAGLATSRLAQTALATLSHALVGRDDGQLEIVEGGVSLGLFGAYTAADSMEVRRVGGLVEYVQNGRILRSVAAPGGALSAKVLLKGPAAAKVEGCTFYTGESDLFWRRPAGCAVSEPSVQEGLSLTRGSAATGWTADALGSRQLIGDGYVQWRFGTPALDAMVGLAPFDKDSGFTGLQHALCGNGSTGSLVIYENGAPVGSFGGFTAADVFRIRRTGSTVRFLRLDADGNEVVLRTSPVPAQGPLIVDCSLNSAGAQISDARMAGCDSDGDGLDDGWEMAALGTLAADGAANGPDSDEWDNWHEFFNGTSPAQFDYRGAPLITVVSGNNQGGPAATYLPAPLRVRVANQSGVLQANAPVTFQVVAGGAKLAAQSGGSLAASLVATTNAAGEAELAGYASRVMETSVVTAFAGSGADLRSVSLNVTTLAAPRLAGQRLWLKADEGVTLDANGKASAWADVSGLNNHAVQTAAGSGPLWVAAQLNGRPVVRFDGVSSAMNLASATLTGTTESEAFVVLKTAPYTVAAAESASSPNRPLWRLPYGATYYPMFDGTIQDTFSSTAARNIGTPAQALTQFHLFNTVGKAALRQARINGVLQYESASNTYYVSTAPQLGTYQSKYFAGDIAEILVYGAVLSDSERDQVARYFSVKYGIFPAVPATAPAGFKVKAIAPSQVLLQWNPLSGTATQTAVVDRRTSSTGAYTEVARIREGSSFLDSGLTAAAKYYYRVRIETPSGATPSTADASVTTLSEGAALPAAGVRVWLRADAGGNAVNNRPLDQWFDSGGGGFHLRQRDASMGNQGKPPVLVTNQLNGRPTVFFNGVDSALQFSSNPVTGTTQGEIFAVLKTVSAPAANRHLWTFSTFPTFYPDANGAIADAFANNATRAVGVPAQPLSQYHLYNSGSSAAGWQARVNGITQFASATNSYSATGSALLSGGTHTSTPSSPFSGNIAEVIIFDRVVSEEEREAVGRYFAARYALFAAPTAPTGLTATRLEASDPLSGQVVGYSHSTVLLQWSLASRTYTQKVLVERKLAAGGAWQRVAELHDAASLTDTNLQAGTQYSYRLKSESYGGASAYSAEVSFTTPRRSATAQDPDGDGLTTAEELALGTDPNLPDSNGDGLEDGLSFWAGYNPASPDVDGDGLTLAQERALGTDPFVADTDRDGVSDALDPQPLNAAVSGPGSGDTTGPVITLTNPPKGVL